MAKEAQLTPIIVPANDVAGLAANVRALNGNALVVGHGNSIPELMKALGSRFSNISNASLQRRS